MAATTTFEDRYFSGRELYGDDFDAEQIAGWFADEQHGYADLQGASRERRGYGYTALNVHHGYSAIERSRRFAHALGFGSNFGDELVPLLQRVDRVTLLDSSDRYVVDSLQGIPVDYVLADAGGAIALPDGSVDLITCFGVLHHIPNVSRVLAEFHRVMAPGGMLLVREPTTTLGDWRRPRRGLTARERGLPRRLFTSMVERSGLRIRRASPCYFPPWVRLCAKLGIATFNSPAATAIDAVLSRASTWNDSYHRSGLWSRFAPASLFVVAEKPARP